MGRRRRKKLHIDQGDPWIDIVRRRRPQRPLKLPPPGGRPKEIPAAVLAVVGFIVVVGLLAEASAHPMLVLIGLVLVAWWRMRR